MAAILIYLIKLPVNLQVSGKSVNVTEEYITRNRQQNRKLFMLDFYSQIFWGTLLFQKHIFSSKSFLVEKSWLCEKKLLWLKAFLSRVGTALCSDLPANNTNLHFTLTAYRATDITLLFMLSWSLELFTDNIVSYGSIKMQDCFQISNATHVCY